MGSGPEGPSVRSVRKGLQAPLVLLDRRGLPVPKESKESKELLGLKG